MKHKNCATNRVAIPLLEKYIPDVRNNRLLWPLPECTSKTRDLLRRLNSLSACWRFRNARCNRSEASSFDTMALRNAAVVTLIRSISVADLPRAFWNWAHQNDTCEWKARKKKQNWYLLFFVFLSVYIYFTIQKSLFTPRLA